MESRNQATRNQEYSSDYESDEDDGSVSSYEEVEYTVFSHDDKKYVYNEEELIIYELLLTYDEKQKDEDEPEAEAELEKKWENGIKIEKANLASKFLIFCK